MYKRYNGKYVDILTKERNIADLDEVFNFPRYFTIETCNNCNARCVMCLKSRKGIKELQLMPNAIFDKLVQEIGTQADWVKMICLNSDGEPLLDPDIASRVKKLKDAGVKHVNISTNGQLLTRETAKDLLSAGLDDLRISIDGFSKETYEAIRVGLDYEIVRDNVLSLIEMRDASDYDMQIRIRMVEMEINKGEKQDFYKFWSSKLRTTDKVQCMPMHTWSGTIRPEDQARIDFFSDKPCISVFTSFTVNYNGEVQLCDSDVEQKYVVGDVRKSSIREIWQSEKFEKIRRLHDMGRRNEISICQGCDHWSRVFDESTNSKEV